MQRSGSGHGITMCGIARLVWPALLAALAVSTMTGSDAIGWLAAALTAGAIALWDRARGTAPTCTLPPAPVDVAEEEPAEAEPVP